MCVICDERIWEEEYTRGVLSAIKTLNICLHFWNTFDISKILNGNFPFKLTDFFHIWDSDPQKISHVFLPQKLFKKVSDYEIKIPWKMILNALESQLTCTHTNI